MLDKKYIENYCMTYLAFQGLLLESMPYIGKCIPCYQEGEVAKVVREHI
jgi:hypothetical protein